MTTLIEDVQQLRTQYIEQQAALEVLKTRVSIVEAEANDLKGLRRAAYWLAGVIVAGAIGFGFSVLTFVPGT